MEGPRRDREVLGIGRLQDDDAAGHQDPLDLHEQARQRLGVDMLHDMECRDQAEGRVVATMQIFKRVHHMDAPRRSKGQQRPLRDWIDPDRVPAMLRDKPEPFAPTTADIQRTPTRRVVPRNLLDDREIDALPLPDQRQTPRWASSNSR